MVIIPSMATIKCNPVEGGEVFIDVEDVELTYDFPTDTKIMFIQDEELEFDYLAVLDGCHVQTPGLYQLIPLADIEPLADDEGEEVLA